MADDFDWSTLETPEAEPENEWDGLVSTPEEDRKEKLLETQKRAQDIDPARQAKAVATAKERGMPTDVAYENLDELTKPEFDWDALVKDAPATADLLGDKDKGPVAKDDQDALAGLEKTVKGFGQGRYLEVLKDGWAEVSSGPLIESIFGEGAGVLTPEEQLVEYQKRVAEGLEAKKIAKERERQAQLTVEAERKFREENDPNYDPALQPAVEQTLTGVTAAQEVATKNDALTETIRTPPTLEAWRNTADATMASLLGIPVEAVEGYGRLWDAMFYFLPQTKLLDITDGDKTWITEFGASLKEKNKELFPADEARANDFWGTQVPAGAASVASFMGAGAVAKVLGLAPAWAGGLLGSFAGAGGSGADAERLKAPEGQQHLATIVGALFGASEAVPVERFFKYAEAAGGRSFAQFLTTIFKNAGIEVAQEGFQTAGPDTFARLTYDPERDVIKNVGEAMAVAGITGGGFGILAAVGQSRTPENKDRLLDIQRLVRDSKMAKIAPNMVAEHLKTAAEQGTVPPNVTAPLEAVETLLQELTPEEREKAFPGHAAALQEARDNKVEVSIPVERLAALSQLQGYTGFVEDVRVQPDDFTPKEMKKVQADIEKFLEEADTEQRNPEDSPIYKNVFDQLTKAGQAPEVARPLARLYHAYFTTQGERSGQDPLEMMREAGFEVVSQESSTVPTGAMEQAEPPVPEGMVRVYHSGSQGEGETGRWVSTNRTYASDYRRNLPLFYTDIPANDPRVSPDPFNPEQGVKQGFTFNFELTPEEAAGLQEVQREGDTNLQQPADTLLQAVDPLTQDGPWRETEITATDETGEAIQINAGDAVDFMLTRLQSLRNLLECVNAG